MVELDKNINNSQYNIPSISLSPDGNTIFFVSTQKSGFGAKDIYKSTKGVDGKWTTMENLGETINTEFDEDSPYITSDGKTLYFASKGHSGIGGYDIFKSELVDDKWSTPENIGIPINSPVDDIYYIIDKENTKGYISSNRNGGLGGMDIYSVCFECKEEQITNTIKGVIADESGNPINDGSISLLALSNKESNNSTVTSGKYEISTSNTGAHELTITSTNYENQKFNLTLPNKTSVSSVNFTLSQFSNENGKFQVLTVSSEDLGINKSDTIKVEETIASNDGNTNNNNSGTEQKTISETFYFDYNNKDIDNNSKLNEFINQAYTIGKNKTITIDIESSASKVPTNSFQTNYELARLRAVEAQKLIANLMVKKGINSNQLKFNKLKHSVNGPNYANDAANQDKYRNHQYVKISIK